MRTKHFSQKPYQPHTVLVGPTFKKKKNIGTHACVYSGRGTCSTSLILLALPTISQNTILSWPLTCIVTRNITRLKSESKPWSKPNGYNSALVFFIDNFTGEFKNNRKIRCSFQPWILILSQKRHFYPKKAVWKWKNN